MTQETLNKAIEIKEKIDKYKAKLERVREIIILDNEPELEMMIREYIMHKIEVLEQEFAKLK